MVIKSKHNNQNENTLSFSGLKIMPAQNDIEVEEEHYVYDFTSFVSEFGGALGLFVGFSFLTTIDYIGMSMRALRKYINQK